MSTEVIPGCRRQQARSHSSRKVIHTRPEARIKMGYYPTPLSVVERIRSFLEFPRETVSILDPCCGEGLALKKLAEGFNAGTYGIELDEYRAEQAKANLDHVLKGSYEDARISNSAFSCLFLNPPYDWEIPSDNLGGERTERVFLRGTVKYLQPKSALVYVIPQNRLTPDIAKMLSYRFGDLSIFRFLDDEYERFRQIVLFGRRKPEARLDEGSFERLRDVPRIELEEIPFAEKPLYVLPPSGPIQLFRSSIIDETELEKELAGSGLWKRLKRDDADNGYVGRPPLPLHKGHLGLLLASGCLDGIVGEGKDRHVVKGKVEKVTSKHEEQDGDAVVQREVEAYRVSIKVLRKDGEIISLV